MELAVVPSSAPPAAVFQDGLGERRQITDPTGSETLELLCLRRELATVSSFEFALRERVGRLAAFRHACYGRVRGVERLSDRDATLAVVSERVPGVRLSEILAAAQSRSLPLDINAALCLIRQLVPAVAMLHENAGDAAHGAIGPERLIVTSHARLVIVEYVLGGALEQLRFSHERYWNELRVPLPRAAGLPRFDQRADVAQIGVVALALILGRPLADDEYPARVQDMLASTWAVSARGGFEPLPPGLRAWLGRALQLDARSAFPTAVEARAELDKVLGDSDYIASPASLEAFLAKVHPEEPATLPVVAIPPGTPRPAVVQIAAAPSSSPPSSLSPFPASPGSELEPLAGSLSVKSSAPAFAEPPVRPAPAVAAARPALIPLPKFASVPTESDPLPYVATLRPSRSWARAIAIAALVAAVAGGGFVARRYWSAGKPSANGTLVVTSNPSGAQTFVDGQARGTTPLTLLLPSGSHVVELRAGGGEPRSIPVTIAAGAEMAQYIELPKSSPTSGQLQVRTEPAGARVTVDGVDRGVSPALVADLAPGEHAVVLTSDMGSVKQTVAVESGATASLLVPLEAPEGAPVSGWVSVSAPVDVQLFEHDRLLGTSQSDRIMVAAGRHDIDVVNDTLGFRATRTIQVAAGKVSSIKLDMPKGVIALNAVPWAEVWIDGEKVGETPIGNLPVSIGSHDIVFRHPDLGEQHHTAVVTLKEPTRLSVDLRKK